MNKEELEKNFSKWLSKQTFPPFTGIPQELLEKAMMTFARHSYYQGYSDCLESFMVFSPIEPKK